MTAQEKQIKIAWLSRYQHAMQDVEQLHNALVYARQAATALPSGCNVDFRASSNTHSDRTAHSAEKIAELERRLAAAQQAARSTAKEIYTTAYTAAYNGHTMSGKAAQALVCRYIDGLPDKETAKIIGCATDSVKRYRAQAIEGLPVPSSD